MVTRKYRSLGLGSERHGNDPRQLRRPADPDNPYRYLEMRGAVVSIDDDSSNQFIDSMAKKYMGADEYPFHQPGNERVVMVVEVAHTTQMGA